MKKGLSEQELAWARDHLPEHAAAIEGRTHRLKFWTGPTLVKQLAEKFREAGIIVTIEGTEHVYIDAPGSTPEGARWNALADLERKHGTDFGLR